MLEAFGELGKVERATDSCYRKETVELRWASEKTASINLFSISSDETEIGQITDLVKLESNNRIAELALIYLSNC